MVKILKNIGLYYRIGLYSRAEALYNIRDLLEEQRRASYAEEDVERILETAICGTEHALVWAWNVAMEGGKA